MMQRYRLWLISFFTLTSLMLFCVATFNFFVDSAGLYGGKDYLHKAARALSRGQMVAGLHDYDDRLFQELMVKNFQETPDIVVMGSSRSMMLRKRFVADGNATFFNHALSGASLEDYMALIGLYKTLKKHLPKKVFIGVDPWVFNVRNHQKRWKSIEHYYHVTLSATGLAPTQEPTDKKWQQLFNYDYTLANIRHLLHLMRHDGEAFYITETTEIDDAVKEADGSLHYPFAKRHIKAEATLQAARVFTQGQVYSLENYERLSNKKRFERFLRFLQDNGVEVELFLPPYHPAVYEALKKDAKYRMLLESERYLKTLAAQYGIRVCGSYDPAAYGFANRDFYDGMHPKAVVLQRIVQECKEY